MIGGVYIRDVVRIFVSFIFFLFKIHYLLYTGLVTTLTIANIVLIFDIYLMMFLSRFTYLSMRCFFSFFIHMFLI